MSREIKFRAWDEGNKIMHNNFEFIRSGLEGNDWIVFISDKNSLTTKPHPLKNPYFQEQFKIMQYTGLKDKNGKEIYEKHICKYLTGIDEKTVLFQWDDNLLTYAASVYSDGIKCEDLFFISTDSPKLEIIGNVFENPELLAEVK